MHIASNAYIIRCIEGPCEVELQPEVRSWLAGLTDRDCGRVDLTAEVTSALHAQKACEAEYGWAHEVFDQEVN
jgi:hypothetical protein